MPQHAPGSKRRRKLVIATAAGLALTAGIGFSLADACAAPTTTTTATPATTKAARAHAVQLPTPNMAFDYQIGQVYTPPAGVKAVSRDHDASPAKGLYNVCYVNAFQAQDADYAQVWDKHSDLLLHRNGKVVKDPDWNEALLDTSTAAKRAALMAIVGPWIDGCAAHGFQAVEPDNLDSYQRSHGLLTASDAVAFAQLISRRAHADGLAAAQKNTTELLGQRATIGFDFAVSEECGAQDTDECAQFASAYGNRVFDVEYSSSGFATACRKHGAALSIVRRDLDVTAPGSKSYVYRSC
ncbi:endo alpha-1,4 polygalactosaminidase [Streptomyces sp. PTM05]|uniref:Endo alpha-1,4 polygalactosaminidase n=1 Tax=Streptantibioticus parmotrematis TaxID=2873249 RepID=A0ABS7QTY9_9ACTN|nr:endo alpha-1,4 polygalactosaminidase [Streptantibioticus parmotrematis]MBY8885287.1 endo alpha-1,4 polygalactosaminidase [Streptantibioticus parmotrematis]